MTDLEKNDLLRWTKEGMNIALKINEKHHILIDFFTSLGVSEETALEDACKIEHYISDETFDKLKRHLLLENRRGS